MPKRKFPTATTEPAHRVADAAAPALRRALADALGATIGAHLTLPLLAEAIRTQRSYQVASGPAWLAFTNALYLSLQEVLGPLFVRSANLASDALPTPTAKALPPASVGVRFDLTNPAAVAYARRYAAELVLDLSATSKDAIRAILSRVLNGEMTAESAARLIRASIGLTPRQVASLERFRNELRDTGIPDARADALAERYGRTQLASRASAIARTESMRAANAGQQAAWEQGVADGYIPVGGVRRRFITAADELVCPICQPVDGVLATIEGDFPAGDPPLHVNCRCVVGLVYANDDGTFTERAPREAPPLLPGARRQTTRSLRPRVPAA